MDCGCGGNGAWSPAEAQAEGSALAPAVVPGLTGPAAPGYFSTWAGDQGTPAVPDEPVAEPVAP